MVKESRIRGKRKKVNTITTSTTTTQELFEEDRISELPNSLLLHIMSFLNTKEVVRTCLLSKRWQFLWTDISHIDLVEKSYDIAKVSRFVDWVGRMLVVCSGIHKFAVDLKYDKCFAFNVNRWVQLAVKNKVENITLSCRGRDGDLYLLPKILYSHSTLTSLTVCHCAMASRIAGIGWGSLKSLSIYYVKLSDFVMEKILSGCRVLEFLHLKKCWGLNCLNIDSPSLTTLVIEYWHSHRGEYIFGISAPHVLDLSISHYYEEGFRLKNVASRLEDISSIIRAKLYFDMGIKKNFSRDPSLIIYIGQLLERLKFVKELELGPWCIEILSVLEMDGLELPPFTSRCLTLNVWVHKRSIPGIIGILKSSRNLETLVVKGAPFPLKETEPEDLIATYLQNGNMNFVLSHLKTVMITSFTGYSQTGEPMLTLVQFLLERAKVLEKMVISVKEFMLHSSTTDLMKLSNTLVTFPRASPEAEVVFG